MYSSIRERESYICLVTKNWQRKVKEFWCTLTTIALMQDDLSLPELLPNLGLKMKILPWKNSESSKNERFEKASYKQGLPSFEYVTQSYKYRKDSCISRTFLLKFWAKNRGCGLYTRPLLSDRVNWLVVVTN